MKYFFLILLLVQTTSASIRFGKCTSGEQKRGCQTNIAGICDIFKPDERCIYQCHCPDLALLKVGSEIGQEMTIEFNSLYKIAKTLIPDSEVGGFLKEKNYGDHVLLWRLADEPDEYDIIRIYRPKNGFDVTFYRANHIVPGRWVIRRFIGPSQAGWRNDTIDLDTGEYLGYQGTRFPRLDSRDQEIIDMWQIQLPE